MKLLIVFSSNSHQEPMSLGDRGGPVFIIFTSLYCSKIQQKHPVRLEHERKQLCTAVVQAALRSCLFYTCTNINLGLKVLFFFLFAQGCTWNCLRFLRLAIMLSHKRHLSSSSLTSNPAFFRRMISLVKSSFKQKWKLCGLWIGHCFWREMGLLNC